MEKGLLLLDGRISRSTFWSRWLSGVVINVVGIVVSKLHESLLILSPLFSFLVTIFIIIQGIKRMHDINKSGWYVLIPIYNLIVYLRDGTEGINTYGDDPKGRNSTL